MAFHPGVQRFPPLWALLLPEGEVVVGLLQHLGVEGEGAVVVEHLLQDDVAMRGPCAWPGLAREECVCM